MPIINPTLIRSCRAALILTLLLAAMACRARIDVPEISPLSPAAPASAFEQVIPKPAFVTPAKGAFEITTDTVIYADAGSPELLGIARYLADELAPAMGITLAVAEGPAAESAGPHIRLTAGGADPLLGDEGYELTIAENALTISAPQPAGVFWGAQTLRQLLPPAIHSAAAEPGPWTLPAGTIVDYPRFAWRGAMLDVSRHFFGVEDVKRYIDLMALYKLNRFHMHLSDDQGWRIEINSWPNLALHGGSSAIRGAPGGYYTQEQYSDIVAYAHSRFITVVPEIDMPGHTNAALASYPELNCDGVAPELYTGQKVGFSSLCIEKEITYQFVDDVIREIAALTPGPWFHVGGDEAHVTPKDNYIRFMTRVQSIVESHGKRMVGWEEIAQIELAPGSVAQHWRGALAADAARQGRQVIMSPSSRAYLDMKYDETTPLGLKWAGYVSARKAYDWDPAAQLPGIREAAVLGVESPLWSETIETIRDIEQLAYPRLIGHAEIGWSPAHGRSWEEYKERLARQGPRLDAMGVNYYRDPEVPWPDRD